MEDNGIFDLFECPEGSSWERTSLYSRFSTYTDRLGLKNMNWPGKMDLIEILCKHIRPDPQKEKIKLRNNPEKHQSHISKFERSYPDHHEAIEERACQIESLFSRTPEYRKMSAQGMTNLMAALREFQSFGGLVPDNPELLGTESQRSGNPWDLFEYTEFPTGRQEIKLLIMCWKRAAPHDDLKFLGTQHAKSVENLTKRGFIWDRKPGSSEAIFYKSGVACRRIITFNSDSVLVQAASPCSSKDRRAFLKDRCCVICGSAHKLEVDHRISVSAVKKRGGNLPEFRSPHSQHKKHNDLHFQVLCSTCNKIKREACLLCLSGGEIPAPKEMKAFRTFFVRKGDDCKGGLCQGCLWYNPGEAPFAKGDIRDLIGKEFQDSGLHRK